MFYRTELEPFEKEQKEFVALIQKFFFRSYEGIFRLVHKTLRPLIKQELFDHFEFWFPKFSPQFEGLRFSYKWFGMDFKYELNLR